MTTIRFHFMGFLALALFLSAIILPIVAGVSFLAIVRITFGA